jgi:hypothetical protein
MEFFGLVLAVGVLLVILWPAGPKYDDNKRRIPLWAHEAAGTKLGRPGIWTVLTVGALIWIAAQFAVKAVADDPTPPRSVMTPACAEAERLAKNGGTESPSYTRARNACIRAGG